MGIAGNKGAVAIRMDYGNTSLCFLAAHFASGKKDDLVIMWTEKSKGWGHIGQSNYDERNANFHTINQGLRFLRGRTIDSHE